jgi:hypothetical protein
MNYRQSKGMVEKHIVETRNIYESPKKNNGKQKEISRLFTVSHLYGIP